MNKSKQVSGYTLVETVVVLMVVCLFLGLPTLLLKNWQANIEVTRFFNEFERNIQLMQQKAIVTQEQTQIFLEPESQQIYFYQETLEEADTLLLRLPQGLSLADKITRKIKFKGSSGHYSGMGRVVFFRENPQQKISYQFQIGSGKYSKKTE